MGIIYLDTFTTSHGLEKKNVYLSFSHEPITLSRVFTYDPYGPYQPNRLLDIPTEMIEDRSYVLHAYYRVWWDQDSYDMGKPFIDRIKLSITLNDPNVKPYKLLYEELKRIYSPYSDVWEEPHLC